MLCSHEWVRLELSLFLKELAELAGIHFFPMRLVRVSPNRSPSLEILGIFFSGSMRSIMLSFWAISS